MEVSKTSTKISDLPTSTNKVNNFPLQQSHSQSHTQMYQPPQQMQSPPQQMQSPPQQMYQPPQQMQQPPPQMYQPPQQMQQPTPQMFQQSSPNASTLQQIHQAMRPGDGMLSSRDIPMHQAPDNQARPNYVPEQNTDNYIQDEDTPDIPFQIRDKDDVFESVLEKAHVPVILALLYFIMNLPILNEKLFKIVPKLFEKEGELSVLGMMVKALLFGSCYLVIQKFMLFM